MKEVLSLVAFVIGVLRFVVFGTVFKANAVNGAPRTGTPEYCNTEAAPTHTLPPARLCRKVVA
jgi:hypothetical protein